MGFSLLGFLGPVHATAIGLIGSGGGNSDGSGYAITGSIGQPMIGKFTDGRYVLRSGIMHIVMEVRLNAPPGGFDGWMAGLSPEELPPEGLRGALDEPAGDGVPNILKYAMGLLPMESVRNGYPRFASVPDPQHPGQFLLAVEFIRSTTANVVLWMEGAPDMAGWADIPYTLEVLEALSDERERIRLVSGVSLSPGDAYFLRLNVDLP